MGSEAMADAIAANAAKRSSSASPVRAATSRPATSRLGTELAASNAVSLSAVPSNTLSSNAAPANQALPSDADTIPAPTSRMQTIRIAGLLGFIGLMPILAIPAVNRQVDKLLFASTAERLEERLARVRAGVADPQIELASRTSGSQPFELPARALTDASQGVRRLPPVEPELAAIDFDTVQRRLQTLGATYYRLEDLGSEPRRYRFRCEVPLPGNENYLRPFEADDDDPSVAMHTVLGDVERWLDQHRRTAEKKRARLPLDNSR